MRKNAFTLVELLAVIVILAIIALIATPIVVNIINDSKENSLKRSIDLYMNSVKTSITKESMNSNFPKGEITCTILNEKSEGTEYDKDDLICIEDDNENISSYVKIDIKGETPINGIIKLNNGKIIEEGTWLEISNSIFYKYESNTIKRLTEDEINNLTSRLPKEYQEVEYIESTGTQYINTKIVPKSTLNGTFDLMCMKKGYPFGSTNGQNIDYWGMNFYQTNNSKNFELYFGTGIYPRVNSWQTETRYIISIIDKKFYCDDKLLYDFNQTNNKFDFNTNKPIYLFGLNYAGGAYRNIRFYKATFFDNVETIKDFIPCYTKTTVIDVDGVERPKGTVGMYDLVEGKFYTNQGTGEFIKGPDV